jgi:hypothetical protein
MVKVITQSIAIITGRKPVVRRPPRHRISIYKPVERTHPWFELRAQRTAELGQYR